MIKVRILNSEYVCDLKQDTNDKKIFQLYSCLW